MEYWREGAKVYVKKEPKEDGADLFSNIGHALLDAKEEFPFLSSESFSFETVRLIQRRMVIDCGTFDQAKEVKKWLKNEF